MSNVREKRDAKNRQRALRLAAMFAPAILAGVLGIIAYNKRPVSFRSPDLPYSINEMKKVEGKTATVGFTDVTAQAGISYLQNTPELMVMSQCGGACMAMMMSGGAAAGDYDNDGKVDLVVTRMHASPILYHNKGGGSFEDATKKAGVSGMKNANGAGWADIDNDGDQDLYFTSVDETRFSLYMNDGKGRFTEEAKKRYADVSSIERHQGYSIAFGDYDNDGWVDIMTSQWGFDVGMSHMRILHNLGPKKPGYFEDVTEKAGFSLKHDHVWNALGQLEASLAESLLDKQVIAGALTAKEAEEATTYDGYYYQVIPDDQRIYSGQFSFAPAFVDLDRDGWQDLAIAADFGTSKLFWNNKDGTFTNGTAAAKVSTEEHGMGSTFGDYDGDGRLDWFVTSIAIPERVCAKSERTVDCLITSGNRLYRNLGDRTFEDVTDKAGVRQGYWGWGTAFFDYDNDGDLDLAMTNGMNTKIRYKDDPFRFWENVGKDRPMIEDTKAVGLWDTASGKGLLTFDYDDDGDLDLFIVNDNASPRLMRNDGGNANPWLKVRVRGTRSNRDGLGAIVEVRATGDAPVQIREIGVGSHFLGQSEPTAFFGLGPGEAPVKEVLVHWPASGKSRTFTDVARNTTIEAIEPE